VLGWATIADLPLPIIPTGKHGTRKKGEKERAKAMMTMSPDGWEAQVGSGMRQGIPADANRRAMRITKKMLQEFEAVIEEWSQNPPVDKDLVSVYAADRKQMRAVIKLIQAGKVKLAAKRAMELDTILREQIPEALYDALEAQWEE
jgi:hypothetical protein